MTLCIFFPDLALINKLNQVVDAIKPHMSASIFHKKIARNFLTPIGSLLGKDKKLFFFILSEF